MTTTPQTTCPPMGTLPEPSILDSDGTIRPECWAGWLLTVRAHWTVARIAAELGTRERKVYEWLAGECIPSRAVRRLAWRALWAPLLAEVEAKARQQAPQPATRAPAPKARAPHTDIAEIAAELGVSEEEARLALE